MILYDQRIPASLIEFGIQIPVKDSRSVKTLQALLADPMLNARQSEWHQDRIIETLSRDDLLQVHAVNYVNRLYSNALEQEIMSTFELIDDQGQYNRYTPATATRPLTDLFERMMTKVAGAVQATLQQAA